jgi:hypothetical protein
MNIRNIAVEAGLGVIISQEADVLKLGTEDWWLRLVLVWRWELGTYYHDRLCFGAALGR